MSNEARPPQRSEQEQRDEESVNEEEVDVIHREILELGNFSRFSTLDISREEVRNAIIRHKQMDWFVNPRNVARTIFSDRKDRGIFSRPRTRRSGFEHSH